MGYTTVFVGNLSFKTRDADLASEFSSVGRVVSANIITRGPRSLGYGFVELESEEDAQKAIMLMNKKSIDSRQINVEIARPRDENKLAENRPPMRGRRGGRGGNRGGGFFRGGYRYRTRTENQGGDEPSNNTRGQSNSPGGHPNNAGGHSNNPGGQSNNPGGQSPLNSDPKRRGPRIYSRQNNESRTLSKTALFVANLPFAVDDNQLAEIFTDFKTSKAHVITYRNRSKGFGFVEFEHEEDQKAALTFGEKLEVQGRKLIVKIALTENRKPREERPDNNNSQVTSTEEKSIDQTKK